MTSTIFLSVRKKLRASCSEQAIRYLAAGAANTAFGYGLYAGLTFLLEPVPFGYIAASLAANFVAIAFAYLNYKFFVFKSREPWLPEFARFNTVYAGSYLSGLILLPFLVEMVGLTPYLAGGLLLLGTVALSFLFHRNYSFRSSPSNCSE